MPNDTIHFQTQIANYSLEYGEAEVEMHIDAISAGERIVLIDDLLATGGTSAAAAVLIRKAGGALVEAQFLIELEFLQGRKKLEPTPVEAPKDPTNSAIVSLYRLFATPEAVAGWPICGSA